MFGHKVACVALLLFAAAQCFAANLCFAAPGQETIPSGSQTDDDEVLVTVLVRDEDGTPVDEAWVIVHMTADQRKAAGQEAQGNQSTFTGPDGLASFRMPPSVARTLKIYRKNGEGETIRRVIEGAPPGATLEFKETLRRRNDGTFHGLLVDRGTGAPVAGAAIDTSMHFNLFLLGTSTKKLAPSARPDARGTEDGTFVVPAATFTKTHLRIFAPGYTPRFLTVGEGRDAPGISAGTGAASAPVTIELERSAELQVSVIDAHRLIRAEAVFSCGVLDPNKEWGDYLSVRSEIIESDEENDTFVHLLGGLPAATDVQLRFKRRGRVLSEYEVRTPMPGEQARLTFDLSTDGRVEGVLVDGAGAPVPEANIWIGSPPASETLRFQEYDDIIAATTTDVEGRFSFDGLTVGDYLVSLDPAEESGETFPKLVTPGARFQLAAEKKTASVNLRAQAALSIHGRLLDRKGSPSRGMMTATRIGGGWSVTGATREADGGFGIGGLLPGTYRMSAHTGGGLPGPAIDVVAGAKGVELLVPATGVIRGTVLDAETGKPVAGADVRFQDSRTGDQLLDRSDEEGQFAFMEATAGEHQLMAWTTDGRITEHTPVSVSPDQNTDEDTDEATLTLTQGAILEINTTAADDRSHIAVVTGSGAQLHESAPMGGTLRMTVPAETLEVRVYQEGPELEARFTLTVKPGEVLKRRARLLPIDQAVEEPAKKSAPAGQDR